MISNAFPTEAPAAAHRFEAAVIITTYQKPRHLRLVLASLAMQHQIAGRFEVVIADDGSADDTPNIVARFARSVDFPVYFTTHPREAFQVARCRNEGVAATTAPYLILLDGDCIVPPDFIKQHLLRRRAGTVMNGDCYRLAEDLSATIDEAAVRSGAYRHCVSQAELKRIRKVHRRAWYYRLVRHPRKPALLGNNVGVWRSDFEQVNGFDENYQGWGSEDDDLGYRFREAGLRICSILPAVRTYHIWHPRDVTWTVSCGAGANVPYLLRGDRPTRCINGLVKPANSNVVEEPMILSFADAQADRAKANGTACGVQGRGLGGGTASEVPVFSVPLASEVCQCLAGQGSACWSSAFRLPRHAEA